MNYHNTCAHRFGYRYFENDDSNLVQEIDASYVEKNVSLLVVRP